MKSTFFRGGQPNGAIKLQDFINGEELNYFIVGEDCFSSIHC